VRKNAH